MLSDSSIEKAIGDGEISISPYDPKNLQGGSYDLTLGSQFYIMQKQNEWIDTKEDSSYLWKPLNASKSVLIKPDEFLLGTTIEKVCLENQVAAVLSGKSSLGRLGLQIHATAGFIDAGFKGQITLELSTVAPVGIVLYPGMAIGQLSFYRMDGCVNKPYGSKETNSKYQEQSGPVLSRMHLNFE